MCSNSWMGRCTQQHASEACLHEPAAHCPPPQRAPSQPACRWPAAGQRGASWPSAQPISQPSMVMRGDPITSAHGGRPVNLHLTSCCPIPFTTQSEHQRATPPQTIPNPNNREWLNAHAQKAEAPIEQRGWKRLALTAASQPRLMGKGKLKREMRDTIDAAPAAAAAAVKLNNRGKCTISKAGQRRDRAQSETRAQGATGGGVARVRHGN